MTYKISFVLLFSITAFLKPTVHSQLLIPAVNVPNTRICPAIDKLLNQIKYNVSDLLSREIDIHIVHECGDGLWYRVAYLNMIDPSQQCPLAWREYNTNGVRACGRPLSQSGSRPANFYTITQQYSRVCGRIIGYQLGSPDGFNQFHGMISLNQGYMDGVSITYGNPRYHIWTYVGGVHDTHPVLYSGSCPCSSTPGAGPPEFIGNNYYCESGNSNETWYPVLYRSDRLWDGEQCEGTCCSGTKSPPWFSVQLPTQTSNRIEVRICADESTSNEDVLIELLEIFVQ